MKIPLLQTIKEKKEKKIPSDYDKYLKTKEWKKTRDIIIQERNNRCQFCGSTEKLCVHHSPEAYQYLGHELEHMDLMLVLCNLCHRACHMSKHNLSKFKKK